MLVFSISRFVSCLRESALSPPLLEWFVFLSMSVLALHGSPSAQLSICLCRDLPVSAAGY